MKREPQSLTVHLRHAGHRLNRAARMIDTECFEPGVLPTFKFATQEIYSVLLRKHLTPRFGDQRLCDISRVEIQQFVLEKLKDGFAWETANHLRNLMSKVLGTAVSWNYLADNAVRGVKMPERFL